jgi:cell division protein FtsI/penicillin-binding protein 2
VSERLSNRRIRLLLGLFALVFVGTLGRAVWLQGVQASTLEQLAARQQDDTTEIPAARRSRSGSRRRQSTPTRGR